MEINNRDEIIGWYGMIAILLAYALVSFNLIKSNDVIYQLLNASGGVGIVLISFKRKAYQPAVLNIIWTLIAVFSLIRLVF